MPNVAFQLEVLSQVKNPPPAPSFAGFSTFAGLGAVGPDLYQYFPISSDLSGALQLIFKNVQGGSSVASQFATLNAANQAELALKPLMAAYSLLFSKIVVPYWETLAREADILNKLQTIAASSDPSSGLKALLNAVSGDLATIMTNDATELQKLAKDSATYLQIAPQFAIIPPPIQLSAPATPWEPTGDRPYEFLRWHKTKTFAQTLVNKATAGTGNQQDYMTGYLCHIASSVTGEPFINNIAGGPYRTHWWRNRFVANFVDTWTYGRYNGASVNPTTDTPTPPYPGWPDISQSNLWNLLDVAGLGATLLPNTLPSAIKSVGLGTIGAEVLKVDATASDIVKLLNQTITATWPLERPAAFGVGKIDQTTTESIVGLFAVVWFMTSGFIAPFTLGTQPAGGTPSWVTTVSGGGSVSIPSPTSSGPSTGATVCGVILAILGAIALAFQQYGAGAALVAAAIAEFASGGGIDFGKLASDVWALRSLLLTAETDLLKALALAGLGYPAPSLLGTSAPGTTPGSLVWTPASANSLGVTSKGGHLSVDFMHLTKSNPGANAGRNVAFIPVYPLQMDASNPNGADADFNQFPPVVAETPGTMNLPTPLGYADMVLDGSPPQTPLPTSGAGSAGILAPSPYPSPSSNTYFFDAVSNANKLIKQVPKVAVANYNLDADRGYGWINWNPKKTTFPNSGNVDAVTELDV